MGDMLSGIEAFCWRWVWGDIGVCRKAEFSCHSKVRYFLNSELP